MRYERRPWVELRSRPQRKGSLFRLWLAMGLTCGLILMLVSAPGPPGVRRVWDSLAGRNSPLPATLPTSVAPLPDRRELEFPAERVSRVRDNVLQIGDDDIWYEMWRRVMEHPAEEIAQQSLGVVAYAQIKHQPDVYRGRIVGLEGVVRRVVIPTMGADARLPAYAQLWLQPLWGPNEPIVVCCADRPVDLPVGDEVQIAVRCDGYFYKRWAYASGDGVRTAPVVIARTVTVLAKKISSPDHVETAPGPKVWVVASLGLLVGSLGMAGAVWAFRGGRRRHLVTPGHPPDFSRLASSLPLVAREEGHSRSEDDT